MSVLAESNVAHGGRGHGHAHTLKERNLSF